MITTSYEELLPDTEVICAANDGRVLGRCILLGEDSDSPWPEGAEETFQMYYVDVEGEDPADGGPLPERRFMLLHPRCFTDFMVALDMAEATFGGLLGIGEMRDFRNALTDSPEPSDDEMIGEVKHTEMPEGFDEHLEAQFEERTSGDDDNALD